MLLGGEAQAETTGPDPYAFIYISSPADNAYFPDAPTTLDVSVSVVQGAVETVSNVELMVDGVSMGTQDCFQGCVFVGVELEQGASWSRCASARAAVP